MPRVFSLRTQLLSALGIPLLLLLIVESVTSYLIGVHTADTVFDRWLLDSVNSLAQDVRLDGDAVRFVADAEALAVFGWDDTDSVYYRVQTVDGSLLAGNAQLPQPSAAAMAGSGPHFDVHRIAGQLVRVASIGKFLGTPHEVLISVGETVRKRRALTTDILSEVMVAMGVLIVIMLFGVYIALSRGLRPLARLTHEIGRRSPQDLTPIAVGEVPLEVRGLIENTNELLARLERAIAVREQFIGNIAHQARTPVAGIKLEAQLALRDSDPARIRSSLQKIVHAADHISHVNSQLLKLARAEVAYGRGPHRAATDFSAIVEHCCAELLPRARARRIDLVSDLPPQRVGIVGEGALLAEMVKNLIDNGIVYGRDGGHVWVRLSAGDNGLTLTVEDDGPGIGHEHWPQIYDRFFRPPHSPGEGCGLGLPIVREIALAHGAEVALEDRPGGGARFVITFAQGIVTGAPASTATPP